MSPSAKLKTLAPAAASVDAIGQYTELSVNISFI